MTTKKREREREKKKLDLPHSFEKVRIDIKSMEMIMNNKDLQQELSIHVIMKKFINNIILALINNYDYKCSTATSLAP